jgi:hypothetical protein
MLFNEKCSKILSERLLYQPLPLDLIRRIIAFRAEENRVLSATKKKK